MKWKTKMKNETVKNEEEDDVDYLEKTAFDSDGWIFRNLHGKFSEKKHYFLTQITNGKNEL